MLFRKWTICSCVIFVCAISHSFAYEINNHADMSDTSAKRSSLADNSPSGKLFRLGLKPKDLDSDKQTFPLSAGLGPIPYCYGSERPVPWKVTTSAVPAQQQGNGVTQPNWLTVGGPQLTIAQMIRYGACFEDEEEPFARSLSHFYNPQSSGSGAPLGPNSLDWMLKRDAGTTKTGPNHFTYMDARDYFHYALTSNTSTASADFNDSNRRRLWGQTFQALGHIVHHLQDMASPQHVRSDYHCNSERDCNDAWGQLLGLYRPSGYETHFERQVSLIRSLAASASVPILFGLPREFWNVNTDNNLATTNPSRVMNANEGLAAYTATNFTSAAKDFRGLVTAQLQSVQPASGLPFPVPSGQFNDVSITDLYPPQQAAVSQAIVANLCNGNANNCKMRFMGTQTDPAARTSSVSIFAQTLLRPASVYSGAGLFQQNYFTYNDAAIKLIPRAVEYSAGLINYFFRGEMEISLPEEGVYGVVDHAVEKSKGADGFRFIKMKVKNTTAALATARGSLPQDMTNGEFRAVAKFRRNTCYTANLSGQIGTVGTGASAVTNLPLNCRSTVDEIVVSDPEPIVKSLAADGVAVAMGFDFPRPIPIEATDLYFQLVFKGKLGEEEGAVAVTPKDVGEPSFIGFMDATDYRLCAASWVANPDPYALLGCADWNPDAGAAPITEAMTSGAGGRYNAAVTPEYGRWLGTSTDNNIVVARLPAAGFSGGNFVRMAVITEANLSYLPLRHGAGSHSQLPTIKGLRDGPFPVNDADYWRWDSQVALTQVQADDNSPVPDTVPPSSIPTYWQPRGVVLAAMRDRGEDGKNDLPAPVIYRGEPLWGGDPATYMANLPPQASNVTVLSKTYYPAITASPVPLDRIAFARGAINRVPATYESIVTQLTAANAGIGFQATPLWVYFIPNGYAWRHTMSQRALKLD